MSLRAYSITLVQASGRRRLSDVYGDGTGVVNAASDIPYRQLFLSATPAGGQGTITIGGADVTAGVGGLVPLLDAYQTAVVLSTPQGYWRLDETSGTSLADSSGNSNTMTKQSGVTLAQPGALPGSRSVSLDGTSNARAATTNGMDPWLNASAISFEAWVNNPAWAAGHEMVLCCGTIGHYLSVQNGRPIMSVHPIASAQATNQATNALSANTWYHLVGTWTSGQPLRLYANGVQIVGNNDAVNVSNNLDTGPNAFLGCFGDTTLNFSGRIDEAAVYTRQLSGAEVGIHYGYRATPPDSRFTLGPFKSGGVKLSDVYAIGNGTLAVLGVPY